MKRLVLAVIVLFFKVDVGDAVVMVADYGFDVTMMCTSYGTFYQWIKDGAFLSLKSSSRYSVSGNKLTIHNINKDDIGTYQCIILRNDGSISGRDIPIELEVKVNGGWSIWSDWSICSVTCGYGMRIKTRSCNNPQPSESGLVCEGTSINSESCNASQCAVNGGWSIWSDWSLCSVTCGSGMRIRARSCNNPQPSESGLICEGTFTNSESCNTFKCAVDGGWSYWGSWDACTVTCGNGRQSRKRFCNNPVPENGGASCQGDLVDNNSCSLSRCADQEQQQSGSITISVGAASGVLVIVIVLTCVVIYMKRRWYNSKQELDYEKTDITRVKSHMYGETHVNHTYQNEQQGADIEVTVANNSYIDGVTLVERYDVSDLTKRFRNKEYFVRRLRAEFTLLNNSTSDSKPFNSEYEIVDTGTSKNVNQLILNGSTLDVLCHTNVSVLLEIPQKNLAEQFWTTVDDHCIENIILLVKENEKVTEFYPTLDDIFRMKKFDIYLDSAERTNQNHMLLTFNLQNKTTQTMRKVKIFKTNVLDSLPFEAICHILNKASETRDAPVLIINSKQTDLSICGILTVCLNVIYAIQNESPFNVLENAMDVNKTDSGFFKNLDDYELCYKVIENYLESVNTYEFIE